MWPIKRIDGGAVEPHAPPYAVDPISIEMPTNELLDPIVTITDFGTSVIMGTEPHPGLFTARIYRPPEDFFKEPITLAADIWTLGINLYEVLGERPLLECFGHDQGSIISEIVNTLGLLPARWWDRCGKEIRREFFDSDASWVNPIKESRISVPLHERMWWMGRGKTRETCQWDVEMGEMEALEDMLSTMLKYEFSERATADELLRSDYMTKWAIPAWERQLERMSRVEQVDSSPPFLALDDKI